MNNTSKKVFTKLKEKVSIGKKKQEPRAYDNMKYKMYPLPPKKLSIQAYIGESRLGIFWFGSDSGLQNAYCCASMHSAL